MVQASATKDVPLGYVCGYPLGRSGGELYGGSMFIKSAANDQPQGQAIHKINKRWSLSTEQDTPWEGRETIGIPVCKKKYTPFEFKKIDCPNGRVKIEVIRMYGCACHSHLRENRIRKYGPRKGWEPFGQWSLKKAQALAKQSLLKGIPLDFSSGTTSSDENKMVLRQLCNNGRCTWKMKHKYDDVVEEIERKGKSNE